MTNKDSDQVTSEDADHLCMNRRTALKAGAGGTFAMTFGTLDVVSGARGAARLQDGVYPELTVAKLADLEEGNPVAFSYPLKLQPNMLVKLGTEARNGIGPDKDIVAFSVLCTHMGGSLRGRYRHDVKAIGPCPFHFSTFDLRKGGIPVHASATQNLPQIQLRLDGDDIIAIGVSGLIYGFRNNLADGEPVDGAKPGSGSNVIMTA